MLKLEHIKNSKSILGEGPIYNESENSLYWTDIKAHKIYTCNLYSKEVKSYQFSKQIGSLAFTKNNKIIATTDDGYEYLDLDLKSIIPIVDPEKNIKNNRFNDGKCDSLGRYFAGTMDNNEKETTGSLYCYDGKNITLQEKNLAISNGLGWNMDSTKFYLADSPKRIIYVYDYDLDTGKIYNKNKFAKINEKDGFPDGLCIDNEDYIWSAHWNGWKITRYAPDGCIDSTYKLPVPKVTSCNFGGKHLDLLFITTALFGLSQNELKHAPLSGYTFILNTKVKGQKNNLFKI
ncbi:MAG: SMP-30/gluconolactonase/LRE family protein [Epsilonproteobacteria bacterium]|nr:SMP-30/gluconolactonase/LRE family protein [Campylobacterota bacterium]